MNKKQLNTLELIHEAAKKEFMEKGFKSASLRNIVKSAGVTTGAFYGYYNSKEQLFEALVGKQYDTFMQCYCKAQSDFASLPPKEQHENMGEISGKCMNEMMIYAYENLDEFKLILCCSEGTRFACMIDEMVDIEIESTHIYQQVLKQLGYNVPSMEPRLEHILVTGMFNAYFEMIIHEMPFDEAKRYLEELRTFYTAGWMKIMGQ